jgi:hypothetical protein
VQRLPDPLGPFGFGLNFFGGSEPGAAKYRARLAAAEKLRGAARSKRSASSTSRS